MLKRLAGEPSPESRRERLCSAESHRFGEVAEEVREIPAGRVLQEDVCFVAGVGYTRIGQMPRGLDDAFLNARRQQRTPPGLVRRASR